MPIIGVGIDVVDIDRFMQSLERTPALRGRLFTDAEATRPPASLAARFAAKEAMAKALGAPTGMAWLDAEVVNESSGDPRLEMRGSVLARANDLGARTGAVSLSHDAGVASALVVRET
jgi:holo-[acyl-carrier protein] synthase